MKMLTKAALAAAVTLCAIAPASAQTLVFNGSNGVFGNDVVTPGPATFTDNYTFNLSPGAWMISGTISTTAYTAAQTITNLTASLNGTPFTISGFNAGTASFQFGYVANVNSINPNTLSISGVGGSSAGYSGTLSVIAMPVPEPAAWGLMIGGFAAMGLAARSKRRKSALATA
jgi:hypothetical protein